jgi:hypothetical protein
METSRKMSVQAYLMKAGLIMVKRIHRSKKRIPKATQASYKTYIAQVALTSDLPSPKRNSEPTLASGSGGGSGEGGGVASEKAQTNTELLYDTCSIMQQTCSTQLQRLQRETSSSSQ